MSIADVIGHWIGNAVVRRGDRRGPVYDPATGKVQAEVALGTAADVDEAVAAARAAFEGWRDTSLARRTQIMFRYRELLVENRRRIAELITAEHGKTLADAVGEVDRGIEVVEFACGIPSHLKGGFSEQASRDVDTYEIRQPLGVVAGITPFNFPAMVPMWMFPIAIAAGNCFILKPSEKDPSPSLLLAELFAEAGLPAGVFNVVQGDEETVDRILAHPDIRAVSFVGSTAIARYVYETAARHGKRVQALGGAKNHMVVMPDADLEAAADAAVSAAFGSAGERCMAISVVVAVGDVGDRLVPLIADRMRTLRVGPGTDETSDMGPLITAEHADRVRRLIDEGVADGANLVVDGRAVSVPGHEDGFFVGMTLFDRVTPDMAIYREEIFGPVLSVVRADTFAEALRLVNDNPYGNGTAIFTRNGAAARTFQHEVTVGMVGINVPIPVPVVYYSFGGWKDSRFGAHAIYGPEGVRFYTDPKTVVARWSRDAAGVSLGFPPT